MKPTPELLYEYRRARERAEEDCRRRREEAMAALPRLKEIAGERRELTYDLGLLRLSGEAHKAAEAEGRIAALNAEERALLLSAGYGEDYLLPRYRCPACRDTGYAGEVEKKLCGCIKQRMYALRYAASGINSREVFANFREDVYPAEEQLKRTLKVKRICEEYCRQFPGQSPPDMLLMGGTGLGKSFLLNAMAAELTAAGHEVWKTTAYSFISAVMEGIKGRGDSPDFTGPELVILDDLGTEPMISNVTRESLFSLINERQSAGRATVWATNQQLESIQAMYGDRFFSRITMAARTRIIRLTGEDLRMRIK